MAETRVTPITAMLSLTGFAPPPPAPGGTHVLHWIEDFTVSGNVLTFLVQPTSGLRYFAYYSYIPEGFHFQSEHLHNYEFKSSWPDATWTLVYTPDMGEMLVWEEEPEDETIVRPGLAGLTLTSFAPSLTFEINLPAAATLTLTAFAPVIYDGQGEPWAWGNNTNNTLGDNTTTRRLEPIQPHNLDEADVIAMAAGNDFTLFLLKDGTVWACGHNTNGQIGDGTTTTRAEPVQVHGEGDVGFLEDVVAIAAGFRHAAALKSDGTVWTWGDNDSHGQLGIGTATGQEETPVQVHGDGDVGFLEDVIAISCSGGGHTLALLSDGTVWGWGDGNEGQLGWEHPIIVGGSPYPVQMHGLLDVGFLEDIVGIGTGEFHSLAWKADGTCYGCGDSDNGELGITSPPSQVNIPRVCEITDVVKAAGGTDHTVFLLSDGTVWCCGWNHNDGVIGIGVNNNTQYDLPQQVVGVDNVDFLEGVLDIAAGLRHSLALLSDRTVGAWGIGGALGDNTLTDSPFPVVVHNIENIGHIAAGPSDGFAVELVAQ